MKAVSLNKKARFRVALLGIYHESNTFILRPTTLIDFQNSHFLKGDNIITEYRHAFHEIAGMLAVMDQSGIETVPVMFAEATPGGVIAGDTYRYLLGEMMGELEQHLPVDACFVVPHGAAVAEGYDDMDGDWLTVLRKRVGDSVPIVGTLDPHANVSRMMTDATNALVAYKTNPHIDQFETGQLAARLLVRILKNEVLPFQYLVQMPVAISIEQQNTSASPCRELLELSAKISEQKNILSVSLLLGFPYADVEEMGSAFIVIGDRSATAGCIKAGARLKAALMQVMEDCVGKIQPIQFILPAISESPKPVLLLDMGDNVGGGASGDSTYLLEAIEGYGMFRSVHCIYDPAAVEHAAAMDKHDTFPLQFGNHITTGISRPYQGMVTLVEKGAGKFMETKPRHGGQMHFDMGLFIIVKTAAGNTILIHSLRIPPFSLRQLTAFGIRPEEYDIIVAKGVNAPVAAYSAVCSTIFQVNTPGPTQADMTAFTFHKRRKPLFPFEKG